MSKHKAREPFIMPEFITEPFIDSHAHLYDDCDIDKVLSNMKRDGICAIVNMAGSIESAKFASEVSNKDDRIFYMFGLHPYNALEYNDEYVDLIKNLAKKDKGKLVGLGEIGLDYHVNTPTKEEQITCFGHQLKLANELNLPISLHIRDAHSDAIRILGDYKHLLTNGGIVHCFSGGVNEAREYLKLGLHISISGAITFKKKNDGLSPLEEAVLATPLDRLLIETDSPFLCPAPYRGQNNEPRFTAVTAMHIASLLRMDVNEVIKITRENTVKLLKLKKD